MNRQELQALSALRIREARSLLDAGFSDGAYYLAGCSVECALKACIAKRTREHDFPDKNLANESRTDSLRELVRIAELADALKSEIQRDVNFEDRWEPVQTRTETSRYQHKSVFQAQSLIDAIMDENGEVLPWIRLHF